MIYHINKKSKWRMLRLPMAMLALTLIATNLFSAEPPLLPFDETGDLFVLDGGCECILRITPDGTVTIEVSKSEILAITEESYVDWDGSGISFDSDGTMYVSEDNSETILLRTLEGTIALLDLKASDPAVDERFLNVGGIGIGNDGFLYVIDGLGRQLLKVDLSTGLVSIVVKGTDLRNLEGIDTVDLDNGIIIGDEAGNIYIYSDGAPQAVFLINLASGIPSIVAQGLPFADLGGYAARAFDGDVIIVDDGANSVFEVSPAGDVTTFLTEEQIESCIGENSRIQGGAAFDGSGNFFLTDEKTGGIYKFDNELTCSVFVSATDIQAVTGQFPRFEGGIAFSPLSN